MHMQLRKSTVLASHSEENPGKTLPDHGKWSRSTTRKEDMRFEKLQEVFHLPLIVAASKFGIRSTAFKNRCRNMGIRQWPYRRIHSITKAIEKVYEVRCEEIQDDKISGDKRGAADRKTKYEQRMNALQKELNEVYDPKKYDLTDHSSVFKKRKPLKITSRKQLEAKKQKGKVAKKRGVADVREISNRKKSKVGSTLPHVSNNDMFEPTRKAREEACRFSSTTKEGSEDSSIVKKSGVKKRFSLSTTNTIERTKVYESDDSNASKPVPETHTSSKFPCIRRHSHDIRISKRKVDSNKSFRNQSKECLPHLSDDPMGWDSGMGSSSWSRKHSRSPIQHFHSDSDSYSDESDCDSFFDKKPVYLSTSPKKNFVLHRPKRMHVESHDHSSLDSSSEDEEPESSHLIRRYSNSSGSEDTSGSSDMEFSHSRRRRYAMDGPSSLRSMRDGYWDSDEDDCCSSQSDSSYSKPTTLHPSFSSFPRRRFYRRREYSDLESDGSSCKENSHPQISKCSRLSSLSNHMEMNPTDSSTEGESSISREVLHQRKSCESRESISSQCLDSNMGLESHSQPKHSLLAV